MDIRFLAFLPALLLLNSFTLLAQATGSIDGVVQTKEKTPLENVNVILDGTPLMTATDDSGKFVINNILPGTYTITFSRVGYRKVERQILIKEGANRQLEITMTVEPIELSTLIVQREMIIGGPHRISKIPGSAHYIGESELAKQSYDDINRVLRDIPGIYIQEEEGYGLRPNIGMRGTGVERSEKITLMEDGVLIAPAPYAAPAAYYFPTVGRMESIEVRKGSSQIKYGPFTTGGALNLISTQIPRTLSGRIRLVIGEDNERRVHATLGDSFKNFGFLAETYQAEVDGFKKLDGGGNTGFDKKDYLAKLRVNTNADESFYQQIMIKIGETEEISNETYLGLTDADFSVSPYRRYAASRNDQMNAEHRQYQVRYLVQPLKSVDVTATLYRNEFRRNWYKLDKVRSSADGPSVEIADILADPATYASEYAIVTGSTSPNENALEVKANNREYLAQGVQSVAGIQFEGEEILHEVEIGLRYHEDEMDRFQWIDKFRMNNGVMQLTQAGTPGTESNRIESAEAWAVFIQYNLSWANWMIAPGVRYEDIQIARNDYGTNDPARSGNALKIQQNDVSVWIPGLGLNYKFNSNLAAFLGAHKGFAPPNSNPGSKPENSMNYELGLRYQNEPTYAQAVAFFSDYDNLLGSDLAAAGGQSEGDLFNGGAVDVKGVELSVSHILGDTDHGDWSIPVSLAYTYTDAKFRSSFISEFEPWGKVEAGFELPYLTHHQLSAGIGLEKGSMSLDLRAKYTSKMRTQAGTGDYVPTQSTDPHLVIDASAEYALSLQSKIFVTVRNLTDEVYIAARRPAGARPGLPRTIATGVHVTF